MKKRSTNRKESEKHEAVRALQDNFDNLSQLQHEHRQRLQAVEFEFEQLTKFKDDYVHLQKRLKTLPDKTSHEVMVPFGPLAFMPGRLIHTNEVMVLLGDNWFAERSAKQAVEIVKRRVKDCDEKIKAAEAQMNIHKNWLKETSSLFEEDKVEIIEEVTEEEFEKSKELHRKKVVDEYEKKRRDKQASGSLSETDPCSSEEAFSHKLGDNHKEAYESLMKRLDQLEMEEDEESINSQDTEEYEEEEIHHEILADVDEGAEGAIPFTDTEKDRSDASKFPDNPKKKLKRRVSWADDKRPLHTVIPDESSDCTYRIKYTTRQLSLPVTEWDPNSSEQEEAEEGDGCDGASAVVVRSPSDIYKVFGDKRRSSLQDPPPRSILKKTVSNPESQTGAEGGWNYPARPPQDYLDTPDDDDDDDDNAQSPEMQSTKEEESTEKAFTHKIVERNTDAEKPQPEPKPQISEPQTRKISRFKAARMKK